MWKAISTGSASGSAMATSSAPNELNQVRVLYAMAWRTFSTASWLRCFPANHLSKIQTIQSLSPTCSARGWRCCGNMLTVSRRLASWVVLSQSKCPTQKKNDGSIWKARLGECRQGCTGIRWITRIFSAVQRGSVMGEQVYKCFF